MVPEVAKHIAYKCPQPCERWAAGGCSYCDGDLFACTECGLAEGELTTDCPEQKPGQLITLMITEGAMDFVGGQWAIGNIKTTLPLKECV